MNKLIERLLYITLALVFVASAAAFTAVLFQNKQLRDQNVLLTEQVADTKKVVSGVQTLVQNQGKTTEEINKSLSCILVFFTTPQRTSYYISDLTTCTITNMNTGQSQVLTLPQPATPQNTQNGGSLQGSPSENQPVVQAPSQPQPTPDQPVNPQPQPPAIQQLLNTVTTPVTDLTCGLIGVLCQ
jgi:hypothetical protein